MTFNTVIYDSCETLCREGKINEKIAAIKSSASFSLRLLIILQNTDEKFQVEKRFLKARKMFHFQLCPTSSLSNY